MTKHKSVLAVLLSVMIVFTFMPTMAFAAEGDTAVYTATLADGTDAGEYSTYAEAQNRAGDGGKVTVVGTVTENISVGNNNAISELTVDLTGATLVGAKIDKANDSACLVNNENVYTYHSTHDYEALVITPRDATPNVADVTRKCTYGHEDIETATANDSNDLGNGYIRYTAYNPFALGGNITWDVAKSAATDAYDIYTSDYVHDGTGFAIKDAEGKVQFFATYTKNGVLQKDADNKEIKLAGVIKSSTKGTDPTLDAYGTHNYVVEYTLPNGQVVTKTFSSAAGSDYPAVPDVEKLAPGKVDHFVQFLFKDADGNEFWGTYPADCTQGEGSLKTPYTYVAFNAQGEGTQYANDADGRVKYDLVVAEDGNLTYRVGYNLQNGKKEYDDPAQTTLNKEAGQTTLYNCGKKVYVYKNIAGKYTNYQGNIVQINNAVATLTVNAEHAYADRANWAVSFEQKSPAGHDHTGTANAKCEFCDFNITDESYVIPKTDSHTYKQESGVDVVKTVPATCNNPGFQYKICTVEDGGWLDDQDQPTRSSKDHYLMKVDNDYTHRFSYSTEFGNGHPVLVEGSVTPKTTHSYAAIGNPVWAAVSETGSNVPLTNVTEKDDVTCGVEVECTICETRTNYIAYVFHSLSFADAKTAGRYANWTLDKDSTDTVTRTEGGHIVKHIFGAITADTTEGADCTKEDTTVYTVNAMKKLSGDAIKSDAIKSAKFNGPHTYTYKVTFDDEGKTATVLRTCTNPQCGHKPDAKGNKYVDSVPAVVTASDNADGSTTYTATLEGVELKDNTKTVYDLTKAEIIVNGGKEVDLNQYPTVAAVNELVVVKINGTELDKTLYQTVLGSLTPGNVKITVNPVNVTTGTATKGTKDSTFVCVKPAVFTNVVARYDGYKKGTTDYNELRTVEYDGTTHVVTAVAQDQAGDVKDATVKFDVVKGGRVETVAGAYVVYDKKGNVVEIEKEAYDLDKVELTEADSYVVLVKVSKEGYTDTYEIVDVYTITPVKVDDEIVVGAQYIKYGEQLTASTGNAELDKTIGLEVKDTTKLGVGDYYIGDLVSWSENYNVTLTGIGYYNYVTIEKRNATIVMLSDSKVYDGKKANVDSLFTIDGAVNGDTLNVIVNVKGGAAPKNAGKYTLVATANDANYIIETVTATYTVEKASQKVTSITPSKKTVKAGKSFKLKAKSKGVKSAKVTFKKTSGTKNITVSSAGKVTVKKGTKAGTYKIKVKATKKATKNYKSASKTKIIKVTVK